MVCMHAHMHRHVLIGTVTVSDKAEQKQLDCLGGTLWRGKLTSALGLMNVQRWLKLETGLFTPRTVLHLCRTIVLNTWGGDLR